MQTQAWQLHPEAERSSYKDLPHHPARPHHSPPCNSAARNIWQGNWASFFKNVNVRKDQNQKMLKIRACSKVQDEVTLKQNPTE